MSLARISSFRAGWKAFTAAALFCAAALAGCSTSPSPAPVYTPPPPQQTAERPEPRPGPIVIEEEEGGPERDFSYDADDYRLEEEPGLTPPHMRDRPMVRAALLLPFSASNEGARAEAASMLNAAELALFERGGEHFLLIPKDTGGTAGGARAAAQSALREGADVILGPLFGHSVQAAADVAWRQGVPVIAFSTDRTVADEGAYLLSFPPEEEVERLSKYALAQGAGGVALLGPQNEYTRRIGERLQANSEQGGLLLAASELYPPQNANASTAAMQDLRRQRSAFDALFLTETNEALVEMSGLLGVNDLGADDVLLFGSTLWRENPGLRSVTYLNGALVAGPDQRARTGFETSYRAAYGSAPSRLASLAYDAVSLASYLRGAEGGAAEQRLANPRGFVGVDGLFRFGPDNVAERALAVYRLTPAGFQQIESAPASFPPEA